MESNKTCLGWRYNFKKGVLECSKREKCPLYSPHNYENKLSFKYIKDFRNCDKHNTTNDEQE